MNWFHMVGPCLLLEVGEMELESLTKWKDTHQVKAGRRLLTFLMVTTGKWVMCKIIDLWNVMIMSTDIVLLLMNLMTVSTWLEESTVGGTHIITNPQPTPGTAWAICIMMAMWVKRLDGFCVICQNLPYRTVPPSLLVGRSIREGGSSCMGQTPTMSTTWTLTPSPAGATRPSPRSGITTWRRWACPGGSENKNNNN